MILRKVFKCDPEYVVIRFFKRLFRPRRGPEVIKGLTPEENEEHS